AGQMVFGSFTTTRTEVIQTNDAVLQFTGAFANSLAVPAQFAFGAALAARPKFGDCASDKQATGTAFQGLGSLDEQCFERVGQVHSVSSRICLPGPFY